MRQVCSLLMGGLLMSLLSCVGSGTEPAEPASLEFGVAWPFSTRDDLFRKGVELAIRDVNAEGGVFGRKLVAHYGDDKSDVTAGKTLAWAFSRQPELAAVIGHYDSFVAIPAALTYAYHGLLFISPGATSPRLTEQGFRQVFRTIPSDVRMGGQLAEIAHREGHQRMVILHEQTPYGRHLANAIEFRAEELGIYIVDRLSYESGAGEQRLLLNRLRLLNYEGIFFAGLARDGREFITAARELGIEAQVFGGIGLDSAALLEGDSKALEGTVVLSVFDVENPNPYVQSFNKHFREAAGRPPDAWAAQGYDAVKVWVYACRRAQSTAPGEVAEALREIRDWYGVTGPHTFDDSGEVLGKPLVVKRVRGGRLIIEL